MLFVVYLMPCNYIQNAFSPSLVERFPSLFMTDYTELICADNMAPRLYAMIIENLPFNSTVALIIIPFTVWVTRLLLNVCTYCGAIIGYLFKHVCRKLLKLTALSTHFSNVISALKNILRKNLNK